MSALPEDSEEFAPYSNRHLVGVQGGKVVMMMPPRSPMTKEEACGLAAWLVIMATGDEDDFKKAFDAIQL